MNRWLGVALVLMVCIVCGCSKKSEQGGGPAKAAEGATAPDFSARDLAGKEVRLTELRGKVVLVNFWATWCPPCREEIPSMVNLNRLMAGKPYQMLALSIDEGGKQAIEEFFKGSGQTLPALLDGDQRVGKLYGITGVPETFVIDKKGVIVKKVVGGLDWSAPDVVKYLNDLCAQ
ncbi:MAG TPA: TlpA disulfide reductase family protein [Geobacteraceae bacterium]